MGGGGHGPTAYILLQYFEAHNKLIKPKKEEIEYDDRDSPQDQPDRKH